MTTRNNVDNNHPQQQQQQWKILKRLKKRPCIWIGRKNKEI